MEDPEMIKCFIFNAKTSAMVKLEVYLQLDHPLLTALIHPLQLSTINHDLPGP